MSKPFITEIKTEALNAIYFMPGKFYLVVLDAGITKLLTMCIESNGQAVKLMEVCELNNINTYTSTHYAGKILILDNRNLQDYDQVLRCDIADGMSFADSVVSLQLIVQEE